MKNQLVKDCLEIIQLSIDARKRTAWELKKEMQQAMLSVHGQKRLSAQEHANRVKFDPSTVKQKLPDNGFKLVYPNEQSENSALYDKVLRKANDNWKKATGTVTQTRPSPYE